MRDDPLLPAGRPPISHRFGQRSSHRGGLHCGNVDCGDCRRERLDSYSFLRLRTLPNADDQRDKGKRDRQDADDFGGGHNCL